MIKEIFTGGPQVQRARHQIASLENKDMLSKKDQRTIRQARTVTRRHLFKQLGFAAGGTAIALSVPYVLTALFRTNNDQPEPTPALIGGGINPENSLDQQTLIELSHTAIELHNSLLHAGINPNLASEVKLVTDEETTRKEGGLLGKTKKNPNRSETIVIFKPVIDKLLEVTNVPPKLKDELIKYIATVAVAHELVHWSAIHDKSVNFIRALASDISPQNPQVAAGLLADSYVDGAAVRIISPETSIFSELEESEAVFITDYLAKSLEISEALRNFLLEKKITVSSLGTTKRGEMYKDLFYNRLGFKSEFDVIAYLVMIRRTLGGREDFCRLIYEKLGIDVEVNGQKLPNGEIYLGIKVLQAINYADESRYNSFTS